MADDTFHLAAGPKGVAPSIVFDGAGNAQQAGPMQPDSNGAVDRRYFVEFINGVYSVYRKQTGALVGGNRVSDAWFWRRAGFTNFSNIVDPRIVFIPDAGQGGQWLAIELNIGV